MAKNSIDTTENKDNTTNPNKFYVREKKFWKFWVVMMLLTFGLIVVVGRLLYIQIINSEKYLELAKNQQQTKQKIIPQRGNIYDRNGNLLASTIKSVSIAVDPTELKNKDSLATLIERDIGIKRDVVLEKINSSKGQFLRLCRRVSPNKTFKIKELKENGVRQEKNGRKIKSPDKGILLIDEPTRYYNYSSVAAQIIGCTNLENKGLSGIELGYDSLLCGKPGYMIMYRDAKQRLRPALNLPTIEPENGSNIYLTIDIELQKIVEFELMQGVMSSQGRSGTAIALDPNTGEVLACASYPGYNPNLPATYSSENMRIRAISDAYEPGSTFKAITAAAAVEEKIVKPTDLFNGFNGVFVQSSYTLRDEHRLGIATFKEAFEYSSNIILSQVAMKIPDKSFYKYIRDFGFGLKTDLNVPGEITGKIPKFNAINPVDKRFIGFGYGIMTTPIQLVAAYSAIANKGKLMKPYIITKIEKDSKILREVKPQLVRNVVSEGTSKTLTELLKGVVQNGTGKKAYIEGLEVAGKTGTAQLLISGSYSKSNHIASFIGYYPANNPKICMLVFVESPQLNFYGGSVAAPIFKNIALRWASISPNFLNKQNNNNDIKKNIVYVPELKGISIDDAQAILADLGLKSKTDGNNGVIVSQFPRAGTKITQNTAVLLKVNAPKTENQNNVNTVNNAVPPTTTPNVVGLSLRRAISILHNAGFKANVKGSGMVKSQKWTFNDKKEYICILYCE